MKIAIRIVLLIAIIALSYMLYESIAEPVRYAAEVERKEEKVKDHLLFLKEAQLLFNDQNKRFVSTFDSLEDFIINGKMKVLVEYGDKDDSTTVFRQEVLYKNVKEEKYPDMSVEAIKKMKYVPYNESQTFVLKAGTIQKNNVTVPVFEITDPKPFSKDRVKNNKPLQVGSMSEVNYTGNW